MDHAFAGRFGILERFFEVRDRPILQFPGLGIIAAPGGLSQFKVQLFKLFFEFRGISQLGLLRAPSFRHRFGLFLQSLDLIF